MGVQVYSQSNEELFLFWSCSGLGDLDRAVSPLLPDLDTLGATEEELEIMSAYKRQKQEAHDKGESFPEIAFMSAAKAAAYAKAMRELGYSEDVVEVFDHGMVEFWF